MLVSPVWFRWFIERAALKVWGDDLPPFILDGAYILFLMAEPMRLAEFEDDDLVCLGPPSACHRRLSQNAGGPEARQRRAHRS